jgi:CelD/BcsL family acetyltransferase involved in cellulose biosynthesis
MRVVELTLEYEEPYRRFLADSAAALFYHSLGFRDFVVRLLGCEPRYAIAVDGGEVVGTFPVMAAPGPYGTVLNSLPYFGSNGGLLCESPGARSALASWYQGRLAAPGVAAATTIANPLDPHSAPPLTSDFHDARIGHITPLHRSEDPAEMVLRIIDGSARRNVQKAVRSGVTVAVEDAMDVLERLHVAGMDAIGGKPKTTEFFKLVPDHFRAGDDYGLYVARVDGRPVAALLVFYFGRTVEYYIPATDPDFRSLQPLALILHRAMAEAAGRGFRNWNWGGSWTRHESLMRFKAKWGGMPHPYGYSTHVVTPDILKATPEELLAAYPGFYVVPFSALQGASEPR